MHGRHHNRQVRVRWGVPAALISMKYRESKGGVVSVVERERSTAIRKPSLADYVFGRRLASDEDEDQKIGPLTGVPVLGLDALSSAAYGPEAALTLLIPLGALGLYHIVPISLTIIALLLIV